MRGISAAPIPEYLRFGIANFMTAEATEWRSQNANKFGALNVQGLTQMVTLEQ